MASSTATPWGSVSLTVSLPMGETLDDLVARTDATARPLARLEAPRSKPTSTTFST